MFKVLIDFFRLIRFINLIIIVLTQFAAAWFFSAYQQPAFLFEKRFLLLVLGTILVAAAGYILNDYLDVKLDMVNKPKKVIIGRSISRRWAMVLHFVMNGLALLAGIILSWKVTILFLLSEALLWIYSSRLKKKFFSGNFAVAALSAVAMLILPVFDPNIAWKPVMAYALFAFLITLVREIVKDIEDMKGDERYHCKTLPIVLGLRPTKIIIRFIMNAQMLMLLVFTIRQIPHLGWLYLVYGMLLVWVPMGYFLYRLRKADKKKDFSTLSTLCKIIMFTGIVSMLFFKI